ncbi:MAG: tRNA (N6-threonylcarbamoyladenosine(37)-N6)-methyltransferase TrmO [bacterium]
MRFELKQIGIIHSSLHEPYDAPMQGVFNPESCGEVEVFREYEAGLDCIEGFSHLILVYWFHRAGQCALKAAPFLDADSPKGIFSIRKPARPNPIGLSVVRLVSREKNILKISEVDILDGTPLLDIKPLVPQFDFRKNVRIGWLEGILSCKSHEENNE